MNEGLGSSMSSHSNMLRLMIELEMACLYRHAAFNSEQPALCRCQLPFYSLSGWACRAI